MDRSIVIDVETSGLGAGRGGRVIEIGAVFIDGGKICKELSTLIDAGVSISYSAYRVHGISEQMLIGQPHPEKIWQSFVDFVGDEELVAHNATFDSSFVCYELGRIGLALPNRWHCTVRLARKKLPQLPNHKLDTVYRYLFGEIPDTMQRHRALDDAKMAARIWCELT